MGIHGLFKFVENLHGWIIHDLRLSDLTGYRVTVDVHAFMYMFTFGSEGNNFLIGLLRLHLDMLVNKIDPVYVFDGVRTKRKQHIYDKREHDNQEKSKDLKTSKAILDELLTKWNIPKDYKFPDHVNPSSLEKIFPNLDPISADDIASALDQIKSQTKNLVTLNPEQKELAKQLLKGMGCKVIVSDLSEGEGTCSMITRLDSRYGAVISEDSDCLVFGCVRLFRYGNNQRRSKLIDRNGMMMSISAKFGKPFTNDMLVDVAILAGSDFFKYHLPKVGFMTAMTGIIEFGCIEAFLEDFIKKKKAKHGSTFEILPSKEEFLEEVKQARDEFYKYTKTDKIPDHYKVVLDANPEPIDESSLKAFLTETASLRPSDFSGVVSELVKVSTEFAKDWFPNYISKFVIPQIDDYMIEYEKKEKTKRKRQAPASGLSKGQFTAVARSPKKRKTVPDTATQIVQKDPKISVEAFI